MGTCLVPYGGWVAAKLQPGESVLVSGATGNFGSAAVVVAFFSARVGLTALIRMSIKYVFV